MYCPNCGFELPQEAVCCPSCRQTLPGNEWMSIQFVLIRGAAVLLGGGLAFACGASGALLLIAACWLLYHYAGGTAAGVPVFFHLPIRAMDGLVLLLGGIAAAFLALILIRMALLVLQGIRGVFLSQ